MEEFILTRSLDEALAEAKGRQPSLESVCAKLRLVFETYALHIGTTTSKLRVLDVSNEMSCVSEELQRFVYNEYSATEAYKGQIISRIKYLIRAITGAGEKEIETGEFSLLTRNLPEYIQPMLPVLPRNIPKGRYRRNSDPEFRSRFPLSKAGLYFLSGCLDVHRKYQTSTLEALLCEHSTHINESLERLFGRASRLRFSTIGFEVRSRLGLRLPKKQRVSLPKQLWPPTMRAEWEAYAEKAIASDSGEEERTDARTFGFKVEEVRESTVKSREVAMGIALGHIVPYARSIGMEDFGVEDFLKIEHGVRLYKTLEIPHDYNQLVEFYRQHEMRRFSSRKRRKRDSATFKVFVVTIKRLGIYNGKAHLVEPFANAYKKKNLDTDTKEARKALRLATYPCTLIDRKIDELGREFDNIVKTGAFKRAVAEKDPGEADAAFNFCVYYVALLVLRFLGYRQQCVRHCKVGENIIFNRDDSITLFWPKGKIKNKKPIKVVLDAKKRPYQKRLVSALWAYYRKVHPYARQRSARHGKLGMIDNQFFMHTNVHDEYVRFAEDKSGSVVFYAWWTRLTEKHMKFDELGIEDRVPFNPHFLRALCINWMKGDLGLSDEDIAEAVGDTVSVVCNEYISKERIYDATRITDTISERLRESEEKELGLKEQLKLSNEKHEAEVTLLRQEKDGYRQAAERAERRIVALEAEIAVEHASREGDQSIMREQARLIGELAARITELTVSGGAVKQKRAKVA